MNAETPTTKCRCLDADWVEDTIKSGRGYQGATLTDIR
jgi:hypothetical protein